MDTDTEKLGERRSDQADTDAPGKWMLNQCANVPAEKARYYYSYSYRKSYTFYILYTEYRVSESVEFNVPLDTYHISYRGLFLQAT